jgi:hypothetical protein
MTMSAMFTLASPKLVPTTPITPGWSLLMIRTMLPFGDHVHGVIVDAQHARQAVGIDGAEHAMAFAVGAVDADADDVADQPAGGAGSWICTSSIPRLRARCSTLITLTRRRQVRLEQLDRRQAQQRVHQLGGARAAGAQGDGFEPPSLRPASSAPIRRASSANGASSGGRSSDAAGVDRAADFAVFQIRHDRLAGVDADGRLRFIGAGAQVRRQHDVLQAKQRMILGRRLGGYTSIAAPAIFFSFSASARANSSTTSPRASLTTSRFGRHLLNSRSRLSRCLVCVAAGDVEGDHVDLPRNSSKSRMSFTLPSSAVGG